MKIKQCKWCGDTNHLALHCWKRPRKPSLTNRKPIQKLGKYGKQWLTTRETWFRKNPPDPKTGMYKCYLQISPRCPGYMQPASTTLDHIKSRSRYPELRYVQSNLAPACWACNEQKGSKDAPSD